MSVLGYRVDGAFTLISGEALEKGRFVKLSAGTAVYADAGDEPIGITSEAVASGAAVAIYPMKGTIEAVVTAGIYAVGTAIYVANDGKASSSAVGKQIGITVQASIAAGDLVAAIVWSPRGGNDAISTKGSVIELFDDFFKYDATDWPETDAGTEHAAAIDADYVGGAVEMVTGATDNNEGYLYSAANAFKFTTNKKVFFEVRIELTEANTDDANWCAGLCSVKAANTLVDNGAGMVTTFDGAMFYKVDGTMKIYFMVSNGATQGTPLDCGTFVSGTVYKLGFLYDYNDGVTAYVTPFVDGVAKTTQELTISGLDASLYAVLGVKAGGANAETFKIDYVHVVQER